MPSKRSAVSTVPAQDRPGLTAQGRQQIQERIDEIQHARLEELRPLLAERERDERDVATFERLLAEALELQALIDAADVLPAID